MCGFLTVPVFPHLSVESYAVVATEQALFRVHHLRHLQVRAMDVIVQLRQPLLVQTHNEELNSQRTLASPRRQHSQNHTDTKTYLEVPPLFIDGNHGFVDVGNELVSLRFPQIVHAQLQLLHQRVLPSARREI